MVEYEYDDGADYGGRVLWGRIAVFAVIGLLLIFVGRCTKAGGIDESQLAAVEQERDTLREANARLEETVADLNMRIRDLTTPPGTGTPGTTVPSPGAPTAPGATDAATSPPGPAEGQTYVVQPGDTLSGIADRVYGDPTKFGLIAQANGITESNPLQVGQSLTIPPNPDG